MCSHFLSDRQNVGLLLLTLLKKNHLFKRPVSPRIVFFFFSFSEATSMIALPDINVEDCTGPIYSSLTYIFRPQLSTSYSVSKTDKHLNVCNGVHCTAVDEQIMLLFSALFIFIFLLKVRGWGASIHFTICKIYKEHWVPIVSFTIPKALCFSCYGSGDGFHGKC